MPNALQRQKKKKAWHLAWQEEEEKNSPLPPPAAWQLAPASPSCGFERKAPSPQQSGSSSPSWSVENGNKQWKQAITAPVIIMLSGNNCRGVCVVLENGTGKRSSMETWKQLCCGGGNRLTLQAPPPLQKGSGSQKQTGLTDSLQQHSSSFDMWLGNTSTCGSTLSVVMMKRRLPVKLYPALKNALAWHLLVSCTSVALEAGGGTGRGKAVSASLLCLCLLLLASFLLALPSPLKKTGKQI